MGLGRVWWSRISREEGKFAKEADFGGPHICILVSASGLTLICAAEGGWGLGWVVEHLAGLVVHVVGRVERGPEGWEWESLNGVLLEGFFGGRAWKIA